MALASSLAFLVPVPSPLLIGYPAILVPVSPYYYSQSLGPSFTLKTKQEGAKLSPWMGDEPMRSRKGLRWPPSWEPTPVHLRSLMDRVPRKSRRISRSTQDQ